MVFLHHLAELVKRNFPVAVKIDVTCLRGERREPRCDDAHHDKKTARTTPHDEGWLMYFKPTKTQLGYFTSTFQNENGQHALQDTTQIRSVGNERNAMTTCQQRGGTFNTQTGRYAGPTKRRQVDGQRDTHDTW